MKLNEQQLYTLVNNTIRRILKERHVIEIPKQDNGMEMPPMDNGDMPPMSDNPMPPMGDDQMNQDMGGAADNQDMNNPMAADGSTDPRMSNIQNMLSQLSSEDLKAAEGYIESLLSDNDSNNNGENDSNEMGDMSQQPMQENSMYEFNDNIFGDRVIKRNDLKLKNKNIGKINPFVSNRGN